MIVKITDRVKYMIAQVHGQESTRNKYTIAKVPDSEGKG